MAQGLFVPNGKAQPPILSHFLPLHLLSMIQPRVPSVKNRTIHYFCTEYTVSCSHFFLLSSFSIGCLVSLGPINLSSYFQRRSIIILLQLINGVSWVEKVIECILFRLFCFDLFLFGFFLFPKTSSCVTLCSILDFMADSCFLFGFLNDHFKKLLLLSALRLGIDSSYST